MQGGSKLFWPGWSLGTHRGRDAVTAEDSHRVDGRADCCTSLAGCLHVPSHSVDRECNAEDLSVNNTLNVQT